MESKELSLTETERFNLPFLDKFAADDSAFAGLMPPIVDMNVFFKQLDTQFDLQCPRVLDAGCGRAHYAGLLADSASYEGIDISEGMLKFARTNNPQLNFTRASMARTPFADNRFHGIWSCCSLNTTPKAETLNVFVEFKRVLQRRGVAYFIMPDPGYSEESVDNTWYDVPVHCSTWTLDEFATKLESTGFTVLLAKERPEYGSFAVMAHS